MVTLVTGPTGLVGNNTVRRLLELGRRVRVLARDQADARPLAGLDVEVARGDVRDAEAVKRAVEGVDCIVHAAGYVRIGWTDSKTARAINVEGTRNVASAALAAGAKLVQVSSTDAIGHSTLKQAADEETPVNGGVLCPYVVSKREAEQVVQEHVGKGLNASIVNPAYVIGRNDWKPSSGLMLLQIARGWGLWAPLGANNYCDVRDVVNGILAAAERGQPGRRYLLGGETLTYFQAWRIFAGVTGGTPPVFPAGPILRMGAGYCGDLWTKLSGREGAINSAAAAITARTRHFSSARAQRELGYQARPLRDAATDAWQWFREKGYA